MAEHVLVNTTKHRFTINFQGVFPVNKWASPGGKLYLNDQEMDFVKSSCPHILGDQLVFEKDAAPVKEAPKVKVDPEKFFELHHTKAKAQIKDFDEDTALKLANYAEANGIKGVVVEKLNDHIDYLDELRSEAELDPEDK